MANEIQQDNDYQKPISIREAMIHIQNAEYVLPGIQRKFTWDIPRIEALFDSIMQGYPINTLMLWKITDPDIKRNYPFFEFLRNYKERFSTENPPMTRPLLEDKYAVIDGQQRLTSLYIGFFGTYGAHVKSKRWADNETSTPKQQLYIDLLNDRPENDDNLKYPFRFFKVSDNKDGFNENKTEYWMPAGDILTLISTDDIFNYWEQHNLSGYKRAFQRLTDLRSQFIEKKLITYYLQVEQDQNKVLDIFTRTNSGGIPLTKADLIMAITTSMWPDMRQKTKILSDDVFKDTGFRIGNDIILRSFLASYASDVRFRINNFDSDKVKLLQNHWDKLSNAIGETFRFLHNQGFDDVTFRAKNAAIPLIQYFLQTGLYKRCGSTLFAEDVHSTEHKVADDIILWLNASFLCGVFGGQTNPLLNSLRTIIKENSTTEHFPYEEIRTKFKNTRKDITITEENIEDFLGLEYEDANVWYVLSLLQGVHNPAVQYHKDHLYPKNIFIRPQEGSAKLLRFEETMQSAFPNPEDRAFAEDRKNWNTLPNLQLLEGSQNESKGDTPLAEWAKRTGKSAVSFYVPANTNLDLANFKPFIEARRDAIRLKLLAILKPEAS